MEEEMRGKFVLFLILFVFIGGAFVFLPEIAALLKGYSWIAVIIFIVVLLVFGGYGMTAGNTTQEKKR